MTNTSLPEFVEDAVDRMAKLRGDTLKHQRATPVTETQTPLDGKGDTLSKRFLKESEKVGNFGEKLREAISGMGSTGFSSENLKAHIK